MLSNHLRFLLTVFGETRVLSFEKLLHFFSLVHGLLFRIKKKQNSKGHQICVDSSWFIDRIYEYYDVEIKESAAQIRHSMFFLINHFFFLYKCCYCRFHKKITVWSQKRWGWESPGLEPGHYRVCPLVGRQVEREK